MSKSYTFKNMTRVSLDARVVYTTETPKEDRCAKAQQEDECSREERMLRRIFGQDLCEGCPLKME